MTRPGPHLTAPSHADIPDPSTDTSACAGLRPRSAAASRIFRS